MHIINNHQRRAFVEVLAAASDMLDLMDAAVPDQWDDEWRQAVRESIDTVGLIIKHNHIYVSKKED